MSKQTKRDLVRLILAEGKIKSTSFDKGLCSSMIVEAFGQTYKIRYPYSKTPTLIQLEKQQHS